MEMFTKLRSWNFADDRKFFTYEFEDETSQFDPEARWVGGCEYYARTYRCRIPKRIENNPDLIDAWIDKYMEVEDFWV